MKHQRTAISDNTSRIENNSTTITEIHQTLSETRDAVARIDHRVDQLEDEMDEVAALASAFSALVPNARSTSDTQLSLGLGNYGSANAVALGVFTISTTMCCLMSGVNGFRQQQNSRRAGITIGF